jgi:hypothetical protein
MLSIITLLMVLTLSIFLTRVATVALTHTGLSRESAKFQARSAFTGVGFTTSESEKVVNHPVRRRILLMLMLLGNAGIVTAVSTLIVSFVSIDRSDSFIWLIVLLVAGLVALWSLASSRWVDRHLSNLISKVLKKSPSRKRSKGPRKRSMRLRRAAVRPIKFYTGKPDRCNSAN